jgi:predicted dithiol-disulfide oxidoreductase (DUF899 family)
MSEPLVPAAELARRNPMHFPGESAQYRAARTALLAEEIELRRHIERVAAQRRALPPGGEVIGDYRFEGEHGPVTLADLFGDKTTLGVYSYMFGPQRARPCPMCTNLLGWKHERGWENLALYSDVNGNYSRDYFGVTPDGEDVPAFNVFTRNGGTIRHFWSGEMGGESADPGQDPRGAPDFSPLWTVLDTTPEGRGADWYPKLEY